MGRRFRVGEERGRGLQGSNVQELDPAGSAILLSSQLVESKTPHRLVVCTLGIANCYSRGQH